MEQKNFFSYSEAAQILSHLAKSQYTGDQLAQEQAKISATYATKYNQHLEKADPRKDPKNIEYHNKEQAIIQQAIAMQSYPNGLNRDEYIAQELEKVRIQVYD